MISTKRTPFSAPTEELVIRYTRVDSPVGLLTLVGDSKALTHLSMESHEATQPSIGPEWEADSAAFTLARSQLSEYFDGRRTEFSVPLAPTGTAFRMRVWSVLTAIPHGATATYGEVATAIGNPAASRAVGMANHYNPISILIPCHRVIGASGALTGYGGGLDRKTLLLDIESRS